MNKNKDSRKPKKLPIPGEGRVSSYLLSKLGHSDNSNALSQGKDGELPSLIETNTSNIENKSPKNEENCLSSLNDSFPTPHDESGNYYIKNSFTFFYVYFFSPSQTG